MLHPQLKSKYWRLTHLYKIKDKNGDLVLYKPNAMQIKHRLAAAGHNYVYIVKPRQFGFTTDHVIDMLDDALWVPGTSCAILAHEQKTLSKIFEMVRRAYENIPAELKPQTRYDTRNEYKFQYRYDGAKLDSEIYVALDLRGGTVKRLHVSEAAYIKDRGKVKRGAKQAVPIGGKIVEESTGNGMEGFYDDVMVAWNKQKAGRSGPMDYYVAFYAWIENPEYTLPGSIHPDDVTDLEKEIRRIGKETYNILVTDGQLLWRRWKIEELRNENKKDGLTLNTEQQFKQEYPLTLLEAFQSSAGNVFDLTALESAMGTKPLGGVTVYKQLHDNWSFLSAQEQSDNEDIRRRYTQLINLGFQFWHLPEKGRMYVIGNDPSDGTGGDSSGVDIWDMDAYEYPDGRIKIRQCAQFFGQMRPDLLAEMLKYAAEMYNDAFVGVENNMLSTVLFLKDIYDNIYTELKIDQKSQRRQLRYGVNTNGITRNPMIDEFRKLWEEDALEINSEVTFDQMRTFVKKENGKREHAEGKSDDALFGAFIALEMRKHKPKRGRAFTKKPAGL
jgi:hypothetical protein